MTDRSLTHATFAIEHTYNATPAKVFAAFASREAKVRWFGEPGDADNPLQLDFRVGGKETTGGGAPLGPVYKYEAVFQDIVTDQRIVST